MNNAPDIRIATDVLRHPKIKKLRKQLGADAVLSLFELWFFAAQNRPDGRLTGLDSDDIELAAEWYGEGDLLGHLEKLGLLAKDSESQTYVIHDWGEYQPWVIKRKNRTDKARKAGLASGVARRLKSSNPDTNEHIELKSRFSSTPNPTQTQTQTQPNEATETLYSGVNHETKVKPLERERSEPTHSKPLVIVKPPPGNSPPHTTHSENDILPDVDTVLALYRNILVPAGWADVRGHGTYLGREVPSATSVMHGAIQDLTLADVREAFERVAKTNWVDPSCRRLRWMLAKRGERLIDTLEGGLDDKLTPAQKTENAKQAERERREREPKKQKPSLEVWGSTSACNRS